MFSSTRRFIISGTSSSSWLGKRILPSTLSYQVVTPLSSTTTLLEKYKGHRETLPCVQKSQFHSGVYTRYGIAGQPGPETANLINVLGQEIEEEIQMKNEEDIPEEMDEILAFMNDHYTTIEDSDKTQVKIESKGATGANTTVTIEFDVQDTTEDELDVEALAESGEKPEDYTVGSRGLITINKGDMNLYLTVVFTNHVFVEKIAHAPASMKTDDPNLYWANFEEFSEEMKESFEGYLKEHNIGRELATYCTYLSYDKEKVSYINMIEGLKGFLEK